jgi:regulator of protease activity HflC (stomatin/prohibitin superfamily)
MDGLSSTEFAFVAALYLFSPTALQAQQGDFGQMLRAAAHGEARQLILDADARARLGPSDATQRAEAAAARRRKLAAEREAYAVMAAGQHRRIRPSLAGNSGALVASTAAPVPAPPR